MIRWLARQALRCVLGTNPRQKESRMSDTKCEQVTLTGQWISPENIYFVTSDGDVFTRIWFDARAGSIGPFERAEIAEVIRANA